MSVKESDFHLKHLLMMVALKCLSVNSLWPRSWIFSNPNTVQIVRKLSRSSTLFSDYPDTFSRLTRHFQDHPETFKNIQTHFQIIQTLSRLSKYIFQIIRTLFRLSGNFPVHPDTLHIIWIFCIAKYPEILQPIMNLSQKLSGFAKTFRSALLTR